jgi:hypothetical protein
LGNFNHFENLSLDGRLFFIWILDEFGTEMWTPLNYGKGPMEGFCGNGNKISDSI